MILVTGATGKVGGNVLELLVQAGQPVRALVRDPAKLGKAGEKVEIARGDLTKPETLDAAFAGVDKVFLMITGGQSTEPVKNAVEAAKKAGVKHLVVLSSSSVTSTKETLIGRWHIDAEAVIKSSGVPWTMIQPGAFASNTFQWIGSIKAQGAVFHVMGDGKINPIDPRDIAEVAARCLTTPGHEGKSYVLSGPEALTAADEVAAISAALGKPIKVVQVTEAQAREGMEKAGMPEIFIRAMLEVGELVRGGHGFETSATFEELMGKKPRTFADWVKSNIKAFE